MSNSARRTDSFETIYLDLYIAKFPRHGVQSRTWKLDVGHGRKNLKRKKNYVPSRVLEAVKMMRYIYICRESSTQRNQVFGNHI